MQPQVPVGYTVAGALMTVAGVLNLLGALWGVFNAFFIVLYTLGLGCCCVWIGIIPPIVGAVELFFGIQALTGKPIRVLPLVSGIGIAGALFGLCNCGVFLALPVTLEIIALVLVLLPDTQQWLADELPPAGPAAMFDHPVA